MGSGERGELRYYQELPQWLSSKESACSTGDSGNTGLIPSLGRSPGGGHGSPLQYSCLENPRDRGAWWAVFHGVTKSRTLLRQLRTSTQAEEMKRYKLLRKLLER